MNCHVLLPLIKYYMIITSNGRQFSFLQQRFAPLHVKISGCSYGVLKHITTLKIV